MRQSAKIVLQGVETHFFEAGAGPSILLVHGGGPANGAEFTWHRVFDPLSERFRVFAPDELAFGQTAPAPDGDNSLLARARHVAAFVDELDLRDLTVVGHSQGGFIGTYLALERASRIRGLVIVSSGTTAPLGNFLEEGVFSPRVREFLTYSEDPTFPRLVEVMRRNAYDERHVDDEILRRAYRHFVESGGLECYVRATEEPLTADPEAFARLSSEYVQPRLSELALPTLVLWGRDDDFAYPHRGFDLYRSLPNADLHMLSRCKHMLPWDRPDDLVELVTCFCADRR